MINPKVFLCTEQSTFQDEDAVFELVASHKRKLGASDRGSWRHSSESRRSVVPTAISLKKLLSRTTDEENLQLIPQLVHAIQHELLDKQEDVASLIIGEMWQLKQWKAHTQTEPGSGSKGASEMLRWAAKKQYKRLQQHNKWADQRVMAKLESNHGLVLLPEGFLQDSHQNSGGHGSLQDLTPENPPEEEGLQPSQRELQMGKGRGGGKESQGKMMNASDLQMETGEIFATIYCAKNAEGQSKVRVTKLIPLCTPFFPLCFSSLLKMFVVDKAVAITPGFRMHARTPISLAPSTEQPPDPSVDC